ncbi:MAG TPA: hypothetical protein VFE10_17495 [Phenylobacterium sp.]|nr:hypothetical protein [Phenylobacterium sp.]
MKSYRIYILETDGRLQLGDAFDATDDQMAAARAQDVAEKGRTAELWEGGRIVGRVSKGGAFMDGPG